MVIIVYALQIFSTMVNKPIAVDGNKNTHRHTIAQIHMNTESNETKQKLMEQCKSLTSFNQEFKKFCGKLSMEQVNAAFKAFDLSGDNQLDYDEFCKLMNNR